VAKKRRKKPTRWATILAVIVVFSAGYLMFRPSDSVEDIAASKENNRSSDMTLASVSNEVAPMLGKNDRPSNLQNTKGLEPPLSTNNTPDFAEGTKLLELARQTLAQNDWVNARTQLSQALASGLPPSQALEVREQLCKLAEEMVFSSKRYKGDPLISNYVIQGGDSLIKIAKKNKVTAELLAKINNIEDLNKIRSGQNIKGIEGPFHAEIHKNSYDMFIYLKNFLVAHFKVGLGQEGSTPSGVWQIKDKLVNPTYYPPRGGRLISADDPENPLGERWLGLKGVSGEASGQLRYGIHGTIEPESIGSNASLGCVRLHNRDVDFLFDLLVVAHSQLTIRD